ncbi:hypothetical protein H310_04505 [Aphanomyces invadans]|uniref:Nuclear pore protein n=1 Tax=Aphanomyces invadans TaxID=157072 RepID=A0A024UD05_9STRA|nr:hypothetical protein H310_04505 [Aphanomyces invadans]ETW04149.1 hypothetical protein H310_04505 [Aphanomyces invadans]|eukprot:XP_008867105.1 hypothetical protein H310_04505 [Aphanomyces invadans]
MDQLPSLQRSLDQLHAVTSAKSLGSSAAASSSATNKAQFLLAGRGFDAEKLSRELRQHELKASFEPKESLGACDLDGFLRHHHEMIVVTAIEEALAASTRAAQQSAMNALTSEFQSSKAKLMQDLQGKSTPAPLASQRPVNLPSTTSTSFIPAAKATTSTQPSAMSEAMQVYAAAVRAYFQAKSLSVPEFNLIEAFASAAKSLVAPSLSTDSAEHESLCVWELLGQMTQHRSSTSSLRSVALAAGARKFFESRYVVFIETKLAQLNAPRGGDFGRRALVLTYVRDVQQILPPQQVWAVVYYLLRSGSLSDAIAVAEGQLSSSSSLPLVIEALQHIASTSSAEKVQPLEQANPALYHKLTTVFDTLVATNKSSPSLPTNRFEVAVVNLVTGRDPLFRNAGVVENIEDFLWQVQFCSQQHTDPLDVATKVLALVQPSEFNHTTLGGVFEYVRLLVVCQRFDAAVESLAAKGFVVEAVHVAISLAPHIKSNNPDFFTRLLRQYIHQFQTTNPSDAAMYIACHPDADMVRALSSDLLLDTVAFQALAGATDPTDGSRIPGALDLYQTRTEVREIVLWASQQAQNQGRHEDALQLLTLVGDVEGGMVLLNAQLTRTLSTPDRMTWVNHARTFADTWLRASWALDIALNHARSAALAFQTLMNIGLFLELLDAKKFTDGIVFIEALALLPVPGGEQAAVDQLMSMDRGVQQNVHLLLVGYMECLVWETERTKASIPAVETQGHMCKQLRDKARAVVSFSGMIKIRLPLGVNERLNQLEIRMM